MAKIVENPTGRRLIRLSAEDVLTVVSLYQQQLHQLPEPETYRELQTRFSNAPIYLPEEL